MGREPQGFQPLRSLGESVHKTTVEGVSSSRGIAYPQADERTRTAFLLNTSDNLCVAGGFRQEDVCDAGEVLRRLVAKPQYLGRLEAG